MTKSLRKKQQVVGQRDSAQASPQHLHRRRRKRSRGQIIVRVVLGSLFAGAFLLLNKLQNLSSVKKSKNKPSWKQHVLTQKEIFHDPVRRNIMHQDDDDETQGPDRTADIQRDMEEDGKDRQHQSTRRSQTAKEKSEVQKLAIEKVDQKSGLDLKKNEGKSDVPPKEQPIRTSPIPDETRSKGTVPDKKHSPVSGGKAPILPKRQTSVKCPGKESLIQILAHAGKTDTEITNLCNSLPMWSEVADLYGDKPVLFGLDTCEAFRKNLKERKIPTPGLGGIKVAGMFNSGTNALALTLMKNLDEQKWHLHDTKISDPRFQALGFQPNVVWGKHSLLQHTNANRLSWEEGVLPVVVIKDPYTWLHSMVRLHDGNDSCCSHPVSKVQNCLR